jgi:K+-transporting ATPase ATPase C chain
MRAQLLTGLRAVLVFTVLTGLIYPLVATGVAQLVFHDKADGSLVRRDGRVVGSELLGQAFTSARHFHPRPSAAGAAAVGSAGADPDDLAQVASGASNLGPSNQTLLKAIEERAVAYRKENRLATDDAVPVDAVTASGSGVDPHISIVNARLQVSRVARARRLPVGDVLQLVAVHTTKRPLGFLGEKGVNVLALNLALDDLSR